MRLPNLEEKLNVSIISRSMPEQKLLQLRQLDYEEEKIIKTTIIVCLVIILTCFII